MPDDHAAQPEQHHDREEDAREPDGEIEVAARIAERPQQQRCNEDEKGGQAPEHEQDEPEDRRGDPPGALAVTLLDQPAEDRDERTRQRGVGEQRTHKVRDLERDGERIDPPADAEEVGGDHLPHEPEQTGESGCGGEDRRRPGEVATTRPGLAAVLLRRHGRAGGGIVGTIAHPTQIRRELGTDLRQLHRSRHPRARGRGREAPQAASGTACSTVPRLRAGAAAARRASRLAAARAPIVIAAPTISTSLGR